MHNLLNVWYTCLKAGIFVIPACQAIEKDMSFLLMFAVESQFLCIVSISFTGNMCELFERDEHCGL